VATTDTPAAVAAALIADCGRQAALDFLIDELIDTDDEEEAKVVGLLIDEVERQSAH